LGKFDPTIVFIQFAVKGKKKSSGKISWFSVLLYKAGASKRKVFSE